MFKLFRRWAAAAGMLLAAAVHAADTPVVVLADDSYPPYSFSDKGAAAGIYIEILEAAFSRIPGYVVRIDPVPWKRGLALVQSGDALAIVPPYLRPTERPYIKPYSVPILEERVAVFCHAKAVGGRSLINWPTDFHGLTFGNNRGFILGGDDFWRDVRAGKIRIDEASGSRANLNKLVHKHVDCYMNDRLSVLSELAAMKREGVYNEATDGKIVEGPIIAREKGYVGFTGQDNGRFPYKEDFVNRLNTVLTAMEKSGEIQRIIDRYVK